MMNVVIDTNVIVSGFFWSGPPKTIIEKIEERLFRLFVTLEIIEEYKDLFKRFETKTGLPTSSMLNFIFANSHIVPAVKLTGQICDDPDDDIFIAGALACNADYLVSGDKLLLASASKANLRIVKPREFLNVLEKA